MYHVSSGLSPSIAQQSYISSTNLDSRNAMVGIKLVSVLLRSKVERVGKFSSLLLGKYKIVITGKEEGGKRVSSF